MKASKKPSRVPGKNTASLESEQHEQIRRLLKTATPAQVRSAFARLKSLNAGPEDLSQIFNIPVTNALVDSWSVGVWHAVAEGLASAPALMESFEAALVSRFAKMPRKSHMAFFDAHVAEVPPRLVEVFKKMAAVINERSTRDDQPAFRHVTRLTDAAAEVLSTTYGEHSFPRVKTISKSAADWMGKCNEGTSLALGLTAIEDDAAAGLAKYQGNGLTLACLTTLSDGSAKALARFTGIRLTLLGLKSISDAAASCLAKYKGDELDLSGLRSISDTAASHLSKYEGDTLWLGGLRSISKAGAFALARRKGQCLHLSGLTSLSDEAAEAIAKGAKQHNQWIDLNGLRTLSETAAKALASIVCSLDGLTRLSSTAAQSLVRGGHNLAPSDGISAPKVTVLFTGPITLEMLKTKALRGAGQGFKALPKATHFCVFSLYKNAYTVTEGPIGTTGTSTKKTFDNPHKALRSFTNAVWKKRLEGYTRADEKRD